jgi:serine protein kinase
MPNSILKNVENKFKGHVQNDMTLSEYLDLCKTDKYAYASPAERLLKAIGEPELVDTSLDPRMARIFNGRIIKRWKAFEDHYGIEEVIERVVDYLKHSAQGLEESKQILYLKGPVGSSKSSLAKRIKQLMELEPFYAIKGSPVNDSPLALFSPLTEGAALEEEYNISRSRLVHSPSPWLIKRMTESEGSMDWIKVVKLYPSVDRQIAIARTEPGDENNQDISSLVGEVEIRKLEKYGQNDPDAYGYSGGLCLANRGILEFVEMFKAPIKVLHPLLSATQDRVYNGTESISSLPFEGIVLAHSNESEWETFKNDKKNEAFIDRVYIVKVPYCLRLNEEVEIYKKLLRESTLSSAPCAPKTLELLAAFSVASRLKLDTGSMLTKLRVYNGENVKDKVNMAKSFLDYRNEAGVAEGETGISPRFAFKALAKTFNFDVEEVAANPVHLMLVLNQFIEAEQFEKNKQELLLNIVKVILEKQYREHLFKEIQIAYLESYPEYGQNIFDRYLAYADSWLEKIDFRDPQTGQLIDIDKLNKELEEIERPAGINSPEAFREEVVRFNLRAREKNKGRNCKWTDYEKLKTVIEKKMFNNINDIIPVISYAGKKSEQDEKKYRGFIKRMIESGYTEKQVRLVVQYYSQNLNKNE